MGDSAACLMRSFTHPSNSLRESQEGDTLRALTESVSFGRFMSESLSWEKWSTFSHNRYLEEAEQFSKPGSVAQKKAFFEAHYKKRAAKKAAAAVAEATAKPIAPAAATLSTDCSKDATNSVSVGCPVDDVVMAVEEPQNCGSGSEETSSYGNENEMESSTVVAEDELITEPEVELDKEQNQVETPPRKIENGDELKEVTPTIKEAAAEQENVDLPSNKRRKSSASSSSSRSGTTTATTTTTTATTTSTARLPISKSAAKQKTSSSSQAKVGSKKAVVGVGVGVGEGSSIEKKRIAPKAVHMSINFASKLWETGKSSLRKSRELATAPKNAATKASVRQGESKLPAASMMAARQQDDRSSSSKCSGTSGNKARPPLVSSPFSFKSEERAARRREVLEERNKAKEAEKLQLQAKSKEKNELYMKSLRQSTTAAGFRTRPIEGSGCRSQSSITSNTRKSQIPLTRPRSPKLGRKPSPGVSVTTEASSKLVIPKSRQSTNHSSIRMLPKRKTHENASPNIEL